MADILKIVFIVLGILTVYVSYWLLAQALFPRLVEGTSSQYSHPFKLTWLGLGIVLPPFALGAVLSKLPQPGVKLLGLTLMIVPGLLGLIGSAGLVLRIGRGLPAANDSIQPWKRVLRGGIVLALTFLLPVVGWIIIPLWVLVTGVGALTLAVRERRRNAPTQPAEGTGDLMPLGLPG